MQEDLENYFIQIKFSTDIEYFQTLAFTKAKYPVLQAGFIFVPVKKDYCKIEWHGNMQCSVEFDMIIYFLF